MNKENVLSILSEHEIRADAKFGQNFLCDDYVTEQIISIAELTSSSKVLEIGPGIGALTEKLSLLKANSDISYFATVEIDKRLSSYLSTVDIISENAKIITSDYLKLSYDEYIPEGGFTNILSNIPYCVMTPIIKKLITDNPSSLTMTFMVEDAAIDRLFASVGSKQYGPLAVICSAYGRCNKEFSVGPTSFYPAPHTLSSVISLKKQGSFLVTSEFLMFVEASFSQRRKTFINSVSSYCATHKLKMPVDKALEELNLPKNIRPEQIDYLNFEMLFDKMHNSKL